MTDELPGMAGKLRTAIMGAMQEEAKMPLSFLVVALYEDAEGNQGWSWATAEDQTAVTSLGLVNLIGRSVEHELHETYFPHGDGE